MEHCKCQGCGYEYELPKFEQFDKAGIDLGTFDVASWSYCTPQCMACDNGIGYKLPILGWRMKPGIVHWFQRPVFRWVQRKLYTRLLEEAAP
jgi:hypothetical protein